MKICFSTHCKIVTWFGRNSVCLESAKCSVSVMACIISLQDYISECIYLDVQMVMSCTITFVFKQQPPFPRGVLLTSQGANIIHNFWSLISFCAHMYHKENKEKSCCNRPWERSAANPRHAVVMVCICSGYLESISATWALFAMRPQMWWLHTLPNNSIKNLTWKEAVAELCFSCAHMVINYKSCRGFHTQQ